MLMRKKTRLSGRENISQQNSRHPTNIWSLWKTALLGGRGWMSLWTGPLTPHKRRRHYKFQDKGQTPTTCSHVSCMRAQTAQSKQWGSVTAAISDVLWNKTSKERSRHLILRQGNYQRHFPLSSSFSLLQPEALQQSIPAQLPWLAE